jgi:glycosyltransferase involved in cell wall biosynthesis
MPGNPLVSVVLPVFNAAEFVEEALESILNQTYKNLQIIIIDDGSTDGSAEIVRKFNDSRIQLHKHPTNQGLISTLNEGFELAQGNYIARMDADDVALATRIEKQVRYMENNPHIGLLGSWTENFGAQRGIAKYPVNPEENDWQMLYRSSFSHPSAMLRTEVLKQHQLRFDEEFLHAEDYEFATRLSLYTRLSNLPEVLLKYRVHAHSVSSRYREIQHYNTLRIIQRSLRWLSVEATLEQASLFRRFADRAFDFSAEELQILEPVLRGLLKSSSLPAYSRNQITERVWHLMLNAHSLPFEKKMLFLRRLVKDRLMALPPLWLQRLLVYHLRHKLL